VTVKYYDNRIAVQLHSLAAGTDAASKKTATLHPCCFAGAAASLATMQAVAARDSLVECDSAVEE